MEDKTLDTNKSIFSKFLEFENFYSAYKKVNKTKNRNSIDGIYFNKNEIVSIKELIREIMDGRYKPGEYYKFYVYEPKKRLIYAPKYRDKVVQIALNEVLSYIIVPRLIPDTYGSIKGRGNHKAADKAQYNMRCAKRKWGDRCYTIKLDIKKFFYNIDRKILKSIFRKHIKDKDILNLLDMFTDSFDYISDVGIPLGNTISQLSANIYLNELDQYLKRKYGLKYYVRYMDDIVIQVKDKKTAKIILNDAERYVKEKLNIELNMNKSKYYPIKNCVNCFGYKIWTTHRKLRKRSKDTLKDILKEEDTKTRYKRFSSWLGHASKANSYNFVIKNLYKVNNSDQKDNSAI